MVAVVSDGLVVDLDPGMSFQPVGRATEADAESRRRSRPREFPIQHQASLQAIPIEPIESASHRRNSGDEEGRVLRAARRCGRRAPCETRERVQRHEVFDAAEQNVGGQQACKRREGGNAPNPGGPR